MGVVRALALAKQGAAAAVDETIWSDRTAPSRRNDHAELRPSRVVWKLTATAGN
jgi:hypothetical protein